MGDCTAEQREGFEAWVPAILLVLGLVALGPRGGGGPLGSLITLFQPKWAQASTAPRSPSTLQISAVQFPIDGGIKYEAFWKKFETYTREAKAKGSDLVVFPELVTFDMLGETGLSEKDDTLRIAREITPRFFEDVRKLSRSAGVAILAGSSPRVVASGDVVNTALLVFPSGEELLQDKTYLTPDEKSYGWSRGSGVQTISTPWGKWAVAICYDSEFPKISDALAKQNLDLLLVPSMTSDTHGLRRVRWTSQARAVEHHAYVVVTGTVSPVRPTAKSWSHQGQAAFLTPSEKGFPGVLSEGVLNRAGLWTARFDLKTLRQSKLQVGIYPAREQSGFVPGAQPLTP